MAEIYVEVREVVDPTDVHARTLVDESPVAMLVYELDSRVVRYGNRALAELIRRPADELPGSLVDDLVQPTEPLLPATAEPVGPIDPSLVQGESLLDRGDGTPCRVEARTTTVDYDGVACGQVAFWDITDRVTWEQQLLHRASHDPLTGLPNAWYASIYMQKALRRPAGTRGPQYLAVFFVDLDGFKQINDTYGHHIGDAVLQQTAGRLTTAVSGADLTARLHGDEFLVLCRVANAIHAAHLAQRIRRSLARPIAVGPQTLAVTASVGIAVSTASGTSADRLLRFADHRMYTDKRHSPVGRRTRDSVVPLVVTD